VKGAAIPTDMGLSPDGAILSWLLLGPYRHEPLRPPSLDLMSQDFLTDGADVTDANVVPRAGAQVDTDFATAASTGLGLTTNPDLNPGGIPTWYPWRDRNLQVNLDQSLLYAGVDDAMCYAACYLCAEEPLAVRFCAGSEDGIQVLLNGEEIWANPIDRSWPGCADIFAGDLEENRLKEAVEEYEGLLEFHGRRRGFEHPRARTVLGELASTLWALGERVECRARVREAREEYEKLVARSDIDRTTVRDYAHFLLSCPPPELRDPERAAELARRALERGAGNRPDTMRTSTLY